MILTVTLNAALDRTIAVPRFEPGRRHRAVESASTAGGKGVNVARALKLLGYPAIATGLAGGATGQRIKQLLDEESVLHDFTKIAGESRINLSVVDPTTGLQTEINERGTAVTEAELERFIARLRYLARGASFCVIAGSVPPGVDSEVYERLIEEMHSLEVPVLLDTDGEPMKAGLRAGPEFVAPNVVEAEEAVGYEFGEAAGHVSGAHSLIEMGARAAIITRDAGCVAIDGDDPEDHGAWEVTTEKLEPISKTGSGDAFLAGFVAARHDGKPIEDCLAFGVACGADSTQHFGAGTVDRHGVERLLGRIDTRRVEVSAGAA